MLFLLFVLNRKSFEGDSERKLYLRGMVNVVMGWRLLDGLRLLMFKIDIRFGFLEIGGVIVLCVGGN